MKVFVDTSALLALADKSDSHANDARRALSALRQDGADLVTSDYILDETFTVVRRRLSHRSAVELGERVLASGVIAVLPVTRERFKAAWRRFVDFADKDLSFTDCTSFVLMEELGVKKAFAFDRHFKQCGFELVAS